MTFDARHLLALRAWPAFADLGLAELGALDQIFDEELLVRGTVLKPALYFVLEGRVAVCGGTAGHGQLGAVELFAGTPLDAVAETDVLTLVAEREAVLDLLEDSFPILHRTIRSLARQLLAKRPDLPRVPARPLPPLPPRRLDLADRLEVLSSYAWLPGSRLEALFELGRVAEEVARPAGAPLWRRGDDSDAIWFLLDGTVEPCGAVAGHVVGAIEALAERPRADDAVAGADVRALRLPQSGVLDVIEDEPDLGLDLLRNLAVALLG